jgi:hypothetical protein
MIDPKKIAEKILKRYSKTKPQKCGWNCGKQKKSCGYVGEFLGETLICLNGTYEYSQKDCAYVAQACRGAPALARAYLELLAEHEDLKRRMVMMSENEAES